MHSCPICSGITLRHLVASRAYWYCPHCRQEVPNFLDCSIPALLGLVGKMYSKIHSQERGGGTNHKDTKDTKTDQSYVS